MDDCLFIDDEFEIELWYETLLIAPPNLPQLHAEDKVRYTWKGDAFDPDTNYSLRAYEDKDRIAKFIYKKVLELSDNEREENFFVEVTGKDLRFTQLDVSDTDSLTTTWTLPCVSEGNAPDFSINDQNIEEGDSGTKQLTMTITASEAITGKAVTIEYCSTGGTASTTSTESQVQHAAYDVTGSPFISYLDYQDVRIVFDASFPKYYNNQMAPNPTARGLQAAQLLTNAVRWLDRGNRGNRVLVIGENEGSDYNVKHLTHSSGFGGGFVSHLESLGYSVDVMYVSEAAAGNPSVTFFNSYAVTFYFSTLHLNKADSLANPPLSNTFVNSIVSNVKRGMGLDIITDHSDAEGYGFATAGNQIANRFYANISNSIDRTGGTDFDAVRNQYGDHPLIEGMTGTMVGDSSEGRVDTTPPTIDNPKDYDNNCGTVTFQPGESSKTVSYTIHGDEILEGDEHFFVDISNPSRGQVTRSRGRATIIGDDVIPCGEGAGAGGTGIEWFDISVGSNTGVAVIVWESYSQHDRFDIFRDGARVGGNMFEIESRRAALGQTVRNSVPYDYEQWSSLTSEGARAVTHEDMGVENFPGRAGSGVIFVPHYPELGHPSVYQVRTDGPGGTAWAMTTFCEGQAKAATNVNGSPVVIANTLWKSSDEFIEILDLWANNSATNKTFNFTFRPATSWGDESDMFDGIKYSTYGNEVSSLRSKMVLKSNNLVIGETPYISRGSSASISYAFDKNIDPRYLEVWVISNSDDVPGMLSEYDTGLSGKMNKVRQLFDITVT